MPLAFHPEPRIYVLHENEAWLPPLREALDAREIPYEEWHLDTGRIDLDQAPPEGIFYNRMSASSHGRGHRFGPELTSLVLAWLKSHDRVVLNGPSALDLEINKVRQYALLRAHGLRVPETIAVVGFDELIAALPEVPFRPFMIKPNRGGSGKGVRLFDDPAAAREALEAGEFDPPIDGVWLIQRYVPAPEGAITRAEFIGRRFYYAVKVSTGGSFELCPADVCLVDEGPQFEIVPGIDEDFKAALERFLHKAEIDVAGIEYVTDEDGRRWIYDINTNTNYNAEAEAKAEKSAMGKLASHMGSLLFRHYPAALKQAV